MKTQTFLFLILTTLVFQGCKKKINVTLEYRDYANINGVIKEEFYAEGPFEVTQENYDNVKEHVTMIAEPYPQGYRFWERHQWIDRTPQDLGYTGNNIKRSTPGPNGYWGNNINYHGFPSPAGSGGGGSGCSGSYQSPTPNDAQLDALCQAAYTYRCGGYDSQADLTCAQYQQLAATGTNVPRCSYCN